MCQYDTLFDSKGTKDDLFTKIYSLSHFCMYLCKNQTMVKNIVLISFLLSSLLVKAQSDFLPKEFRIVGNVGVTNNGISIIPTFSLKAPALNATFSISKGGRFSIDPDVRLTFDARKGGGMVWFRYKIAKDKKLRFTVGAHPAYNLALRTITENGKSWTITQTRRFVATELAPSYSFNKHFGLGAYYLHGNGLQKDGPISTHYVNLSMPITGVPLGTNLLWSFSPQVYYLQVDREDGFYLTGNTVISSKKSPFALMALYNKEIRTNIAGSKNFDWNISLLYTFNNKYKLVK